MVERAAELDSGSRKKRSGQWSSAGLVRSGQASRSVVWTLCLPLLPPLVPVLLRMEKGPPDLTAVKGLVLLAAPPAGTGCPPVSEQLAEP